MTGTGGTLPSCTRPGPCPTHSGWLLDPSPTARPPGSWTYLCASVPAATPPPHPPPCVLCPCTLLSILVRCPEVGWRWAALRGAVVDTSQHWLHPFEHARCPWLWLQVGELALAGAGHLQHHRGRPQRGAAAGDEHRGALRPKFHQWRPGPALVRELLCKCSCCFFFHVRVAPACVDAPSPSPLPSLWLGMSPTCLDMSTVRAPHGCGCVWVSPSLGA